MEAIKQEEVIQHEIDLDEMDRGIRMEDEMMLLDEEHKIGVLEELLEDSRMTDEQKGTIQEILNAIRENPINDVYPNNVTTPTG